MSDVRKNSGLFVHYSFFKDYTDAQDAQNNFLKKYCDNLNDSLYNQGQTLNNLNDTVVKLQQRITALEQNMKDAGFTSKSSIPAANNEEVKG